MRWVGAVALVIAVMLPTAAPAVAAPAPSVSCPEQLVPPPPDAPEELPAPAAVPRPAEPVGGPQLDTCSEAGTTGAPAVGAAAWVLADLDTGAVLAARAPHARHRPASALKVLTAMVVLRRMDPDAVVEGTPEDAGMEGSRAGIGPGGRYTVRQLLAGLLLNSGNDTAHALARALGGDAATVAAMTSLAGELGALDTRPGTPSGLDGPGMACSAYDLALLFRVAMRDPIFASTIASRSVEFPGYGATPGFILSNSSKLLDRYPGALGGKTGFTDAARHTLVGAAERDGRRLVVALVRGEQSPVPMWQQAGALLDWGFARPAGPEPVGTLVDAAPPPPPPPPAPPALAAPAALQPAATGPDGPAPLPLMVAGVVAAAVVVAGGVVGLVRRRR